MKGVLIFVLLLPTLEGGQLQRCYGADLGCYPVVIPPFYPHSLANIDAEFRLYTTPTANYEIMTKDNVLSTQFNGSLKTVVIAHGYTSNPDVEHVAGLKDAILQQEDANVITVDGEDALSFGFAAFSNALVVGGLLEQMIRATISLAGARYSDYHLIGQSMGCSLVASAAQRAKEHGGLIGRVTGLDPAGPFYDSIGSSVMIDSNDAAFVDCIRTDVGVVGSSLPCGTVDYYPNGGRDQPGCDDNNCSHRRAFYLYLESVNSICNFLGIPCSSADEFLAGRCSDYVPGDISVMGYSLEGQQHKTGRFFMTTNSMEPYCIDIVGR